MGLFSEIEIKSSGKFLKVESGHPIQIRLLSDSPEERVLHGFGKEAIECEGENCSKCEEGSEAKQRWSVAVYNHEVNKPMVWDFGAGVCRALQGVYKTLKTQDIKITTVDLMVDATGEKMQKKYQITPMMKSKPVPESLDINDLPF